jgi:hypothetical protein
MRGAFCLDRCNMPGGDGQANQRRAIEHYEAALQVYTYEEFPIDWAMTQYNRGNAYASLRGENRKITLERATACFQASLHIFKIMHMESHGRVVIAAMKKAQEALKNLI